MREWATTEEKGARTGKEGARTEQKGARTGKERERTMEKGQELWRRGTLRRTGKELMGKSGVRSLHVHERLCLKYLYCFVSL